MRAEQIYWQAALQVEQKYLQEVLQVVRRNKT
jgi:hypothetical protein